MHEPAEHVRRVVRRAIARADTGDLQVLLVLLGDNVHGVVKGHDTQNVTVLVANGDGDQVVLGHLVRYVFLVIVGRHINQVAIGELAQRGVAIGHDERAQRKHAGEHAARVFGIDVVDALEVLVELADRLDGVTDRRRGGQGDKLRGHDAAGGVVLVAQQVTNRLLLLNAHQAQQLLGLLVIELVNQVGGVVRIHHGQHRRCVRIGQALEHLGHKLVVIELRDGLGGLGSIELRKHLRTQARVELLDNVGDVGRVQLAERLVRHRELNVLGRAVEQVHVGPSDDVLTEWLAQMLHKALDDMLECGADCAQQTAGTNFGTQQAQLIFARHGKLDVVYAHDLHALRVDNLLVEHVARKQEFGRLQVRKTDFGCRRLKVYTRLVDTVDPFAPADHKRRLAGPAERERRHVRKNFAGSNAKIVHNAELFAIDVQDRQFEHLTQIIHWCSPSLSLRTAAIPARRPWTFRYVYACAGGTPLDAYTPRMRKKHLHGVIDCMVEVWISPVTFLLTLINRSNYSISIALRHRIYALHIAGIPNADASVT